MFQCFSVGLPRLKPTATSWSGKNCLEAASPHLKPTTTISSGRGGDERVPLGERLAVAAVLLLRDACLGGAREANVPVSWLSGVAFGAGTRIAEFMKLCRG